jgi:hypothetical protein
MGCMDSELPGIFVNSMLFVICILPVEDFCNSMMGCIGQECVWSEREPCNYVRVEMLELHLFSKNRISDFYKC